LATDQSNGKEVVLKFFRPDRLTPTDEYRWECFEREARVLAEFSGARDIIGLVAGQSEFTEYLQTTIPGIENWSPDAMPNAFRVMARALQRGT
jgi:hypothetical protein